MNRTLVSALLTLFAAAVVAAGAGQDGSEYRAAAPPTSDAPSFERLDQNGDGAISRAEAEAHRQLVQQWQELDQDADGRLDQSELSAFEVDDDADER